jgi:hypothetical protein
MPATTKTFTWPACPFDPKCKARVPIYEPLRVEIERQYGKLVNPAKPNWETIEMNIRAGMSARPAEMRRWSPERIYQAMINVRHVHGTLPLGSGTNTNTGQIISIGGSHSRPRAGDGIDDEDVIILKALADATLLLEHGKVAERLTNARTPLSLKTIGDRLRKLEKLGHVEYPNGPRSGVRITDHGRSLLISRS